MDVKFKLTGLAHLDTAFQELSKRLQNKIAREALRPAAKIVQQECRALAPVKTGAVRRAIVVRAAPRTRKNVVRFNTQIGAGNFSGETFYGAFVDLGHKTGKRGSAGRTQVPAVDFMRRGAENARDAAINTARELIREGILSEARELGRVKESLSP